MKKFYAICLLFMLGFFLQMTQEASAVTKLSSGKWVTGYITESKIKNSYQFTIKKPSKVTIEAISYMEQVEIFTWNSKKEEVIPAFYFSNASVGNAVERKQEIYLLPGTYKIQANRIQYSNHTGSYRIKVKWEEQTTNEVEPNDTKEKAQFVELNKLKITGQMGWNDPADYYRVNVTKPGKLTVNATSYVSGLNVELYNNNLKQMDNESNFLDADEYNRVTKSLSTYVEKGTYYIKVTKSSITGATGKYVLQPKFTATNNKEKESNNSIKKAHTLKMNGNRLTGLISFSDRVDYYKVKVPKNAKVDVQIKSHMPKLRVELYNSALTNLKQLESFRGATESRFVSKTLTKTLKPGTYYIAIKDKGSLGTYQINVRIVKLLPKAK